MNQQNLNRLIRTRRFHRYVVDGDEILVQEFGIRLDDEPDDRWRAFLNRSSDFGDSARWRVYEAARIASRKIPASRAREEVDGEMRAALVQSWHGISVPDDIDELFGGVTLKDFVGPRTLRELRVERDRPRVMGGGVS